MKLIINVFLKLVRFNRVLKKFDFLKIIHLPILKGAVNIKNIVLIGMMGSGKSFFSQKLSQVFNIELIETDLLIKQQCNMTIKEIFDTFGEKYFRTVEASVAESVSKLDSKVISTGGGIILNYENIKNFKRSGLIFFIDRGLNDLLNSVEIEHRPLLASGRENIVRIYNERIDLYNKYADVCIKNDRDPEAVLNDLINIIKERSDDFSEI